MKKWAHIENGVAIQVIETDPAISFHPEVAALFVQVPDETAVGSAVDAEGNWTHPDPDKQKPEPEPIPEVPPTVSRVKFKMLWTSAERIATKKLRETDAIVDDFWDLLDDPQTTEVVMALQSVQEAIEYTLTAIKKSGIDLDVPIRKSEILSGVLK